MLCSEIVPFASTVHVASPHSGDMGMRSQGRASTEKLPTIQCVPPGFPLLGHWGLEQLYYSRCLALGDREKGGEGGERGEGGEKGKEGGRGGTETETETERERQR